MQLLTPCRVESRGMLMSVWTSFFISQLAYGQGTEMKSASHFLLLQRTSWCVQ